MFYSHTQILVGKAVIVKIPSPFQEWMDVNLAWNETEYGNVQDVRIPPSSLWKPDILMYNRLVSIRA